MIIDARRVLIFRIVGAITQVFVGVFGVHFDAVMAEKFLLIGCLHEEVVVPFAPDIDVFVAQPAHDAARTAALGVVIIDVRGKTVFKKGTFNAGIAYITVGASACGILIFGLITERIVAL